jgi:hypothetical protein
MGVGLGSVSGNSGHAWQSNPRVPWGEVMNSRGVVKRVTEHGEDIDG